MVAHKRPADRLVRPPSEAPEDVLEDEDTDEDTEDEDDTDEDSEATENTVGLILENIRLREQMAASSDILAKAKETNKSIEERIASVREEIASLQQAIGSTSDTIPETGSSSDDPTPEQKLPR